MIRAIAEIMGGVLSLVFGCLDIFAPSLMIRWQISSTAKHEDYRRAVGTGVQQWLNIDTAGEPWNDPSVRLKVRLLGGLLACVGLAVIGFGVYLLGRGLS
jgi:hypothetical protein